MIEDVITEDYQELDDELVPDTFQDNFKSSLINLPRRIAGVFGRVRRIGPWIIRGTSGFREFMSDPGPKIRASMTKLRKELDTLTSVQLAAVVITFTLFLILPLISVVAYSFTDPSTGALSLFHFRNLFSDPNIWPWYFDPISESW